MAAPTNNNTLTNLIPDAYAALDVVSRELTGFIPTVARDSRADMVAVGQTLRSIVAPVNSSGADITPAMAIPSALNQSIGNKSLTITKSRFYGFSWSGEDIMAVDKGPGYLTIQQDQIAQALRTAVNEVEADIAAAASAGASRAFGATADTAPLISDFSQAKKILDDNGAPGSDRHAILSTAGGVAVRGYSNLFKVNEGGDTTLLRQGQLGDLYGFALRESAQVVRPTAGGMTGALVNGALSIGATAIVFDTGTVNTTGFVAGDIITIAGDTNKYVVTTGLAAASGTITIAAPGLLRAAADNAAITVFGTSSRNCAFSRNAIVLATRLPAIPPQGDMAIDRQVITDPRTGLSFELAMYPGYRMNTYHVSLAWGITVFKPEHLAIIIGGV
jgi:hypothetical protein